jgi:hypothetical protein
MHIEQVQDVVIQNAQFLNNSVQAARLDGYGGGLSLVDVTFSQISNCTFA